MDFNNESGYEQLEELLKANFWLEADDKTHELMDNISRGEKISVFPCSHLYKIDRLWVQHSDGKFGFSVQKRIWDDICETVEDLSWSSYEARRREFCKRVGWRKTDDEEKDIFQQSVPYPKFCLSKAGQLPNGSATNFFMLFTNTMAYSAEYQHRYWYDDIHSGYGINFDSLLDRIAVCGLTDLGNNENNFAECLTNLKHSLDPNLRGISAHMLGKIGSDAAISALISAIDDPSLNVRKSIIHALGKIGSNAAIPALISAIERLELDLCRLAIEALRKIGSNAAISVLLDTIEHSNSDVRRYTVNVLGRINSEIVVPAILKATDDPDISVCMNAIHALGKIGSDARILALLKVINNRNLAVRKIAANELGIMSLNINSDTVFSALSKAIDNSDLEVRRIIVDALAKIASDAVIPALLQAIEDPDIYIRRSAASTLITVSSDAEISTLIKAIDDPDLHVRRSAADALRTIGSDSAISALSKAIKTPRPFNIFKPKLDELDG